MGARPDLVEVELDDELADEPRPPRTPWTARAWSRAAAVLAVVVALATTAHASQAATSAAGYAGNGLAADLTVPLSELWSADGVMPIAVVGDLLLTSDQGTGEGARALRLADGSEAWRYDGGYCSIIGMDTRPIWPSGVYDPARSRVECDTYTNDGSTARTYLDPADGRVLIDLSGAGYDTAVQVSGGYLMIVDAAGERTVEVWSLVSGEHLWATELGTTSADVVATAHQVQVTGDPSTADRAFDLVTGAPEQPLDEPAADGWHYLLADGSRVQTTVGDDGMPVVAVTGPDGGERWTAPGYTYPAAARDGSNDGVVLVESMDGAATRALDAVTGVERWALDTWAAPAVSARGVLVLLVQDQTSSAAPQVEVVDALTGTERWPAPEGMLSAWQVPVSDGQDVGFVIRLDGLTQLVTFDLVTGEHVTAWPVPRDDDPSAVPLPHGGLMLYGSTGLTVLGP